jgi:hypothetical protein
LPLVRVIYQFVQSGSNGRLYKIAQSPRRKIVAAMPQLVDRGGHETVKTAAGRSRALPVLLATLSVRVDPSAEAMAIDSALEAGVRLIVANMLLLPPYPLTVMLSPAYATLPHEEDLDAVRETAARAAARGSRPSCCGS